MPKSKPVEPPKPVVVEAPPVLIANLTTFEKKEILEYKQVYYQGERANKDYDPKGPNNGFDSVDGFYEPYKFDHIAYRFEILHSIGKGVFGQVFKVFDHATNTEVALKIIKNEKDVHNFA